MESVFFGNLKKGLEIRRLWELKGVPDNSAGGEVCLGYNRNGAGVGTHTDPRLPQDPLDLETAPLPLSLPIQSRGSPKALPARKTLGIPSSEKTLKTAGFRPAKDGGVGTDGRGAWRGWEAPSPRRPQGC